MQERSEWGEERATSLCSCSLLIAAAFRPLSDRQAAAGSHVELPAAAALHFAEGRGPAAGVHPGRLR